jgi:hypothetical protein
VGGRQKDFGKKISCGVSELPVVGFKSSFEAYNPHVAAFIIFMFDAEANSVHASYIIHFQIKPELLK